MIWLSWPVWVGGFHDSKMLVSDLASPLKSVGWEGTVKMYDTNGHFSSCLYCGNTLVDKLSPPGVTWGSYQIKLQLNCEYCLHKAHPIRVFSFKLEIFIKCFYHNAIHLLRIIWFFWFVYTKLQFKIEKKKKSNEVIHSWAYIKIHHMALHCIYS